MKRYLFKNVYINDNAETMATFGHTKPRTKTNKNKKHNIEN
jgi:hypothetical protein